MGEFIVGSRPILPPLLIRYTQDNNVHIWAHVQPTASTPTSTIQQVSSVARNLCKEGNRDHLTMENHHHVNSCNRHCCLKVTSAINLA